MKNKITFIISTVIITCLLLAVVSTTLAATDPLGGQTFESAWTSWDPDQPESSIPYIDVWGTVYNINSTYNIEWRLSVTKNGISQHYWDYSGTGNINEIWRPVTHAESSQYSAYITVFFF